MTEDQKKRVLDRIGKYWSEDGDKYDKDAGYAMEDIETIVREGKDGD